MTPLRSGPAVLILLSAPLAALAQNNAPVVSNVTAAQRNDGSTRVDIRYNLADADGDACTITVQCSGDGGSTWTVPITAVSGAVGSGITPGRNKLITWNFATNLPGAFSSQYTIRVIADDRSGPTPPGMVPISAGPCNLGDTFDEGATDELPVHSANISAFYMDRYEVTNQQYADALNWAEAQGNLITVTGGVVYKFNSGTSFPYCDTTTSSSESRITWNGTTFGVVAGKANHPMALVSWYGAAAYSNWQSGIQGRTPCYDTGTWRCNFAGDGYRLPTEAEWEKAARGGAAGRRFPWSDQDTIQHARANYYSSANYAYDTSPTRNYHPVWGGGNPPFTAPVGFFDGSLRYKADFNWPGTPSSYQTENGANGYGLYDMAGNVREWCNDWYQGNYYFNSPGTNPRGPVFGFSRVLRGGGWSAIAYNCRCAHRRLYSPDFRSDRYGFRCAVGTPTGDIDGDGQVTAADVKPFVGVLLGQVTDPYHVAASDLNQSGTVDGLDIQLFIDLLLTQ